MKLYQTVDGTLIGFYQERGGAVQCTMYRDVYEKKVVTKMVEKEITVPEERPGYLMSGHWEDMPRKYYIPEKVLTLFRIVDGHYETETIWIKGHWETKEIWIPEHQEEHFVEVPGYYETRYRPTAMAKARGLSEPTEPYEFWVDVSWEYQTVDVPGQFRDHRVWLDGNFEDINVWVPAHEEQYEEVVPAHHEIRTERIWFPPKWEPAYQVLVTKTIMVEETTIEEVWVGYEPVYEYVDPSQVTTWEVNELIKAPADQPDVEDVIVITNTLTGEVLETTATYLGLAEKIDDNEFVVPQ